MNGLAYSPWFWLATCVALLGYHAYVIVLVLRSGAFTQMQKLTQVALIALLPIVGAVVAHWFAKHGVQALPHSDREFVAQERPTLGQR